MKVSVYLHEEIYSILRCYGDIDVVVNKVLDEASKGSFDVMDKPTVPSRDGARRFDVDIRNRDYLELLQAYPPNSARISLRRLLYWFVENEMYEMLDWELVDTYRDKNYGKRMDLIKNIRQNLEKLCTICTGKTREDAERALNLIQGLET